MKHIHVLSTLTALIVTLSACKKENSIADNGLIGNWRLVEVYSGYANGGTYTWHTVADENTHSLLFAADGKYVKKESSGSAFQQCTGTYQLLPENWLEVKSSCQTVVETIKISELTKRLLVIDRSGREGTIRYKYEAGL